MLFLSSLKLTITFFGSVQAEIGLVMALMSLNLSEIGLVMAWMSLVLSEIGLV